MKSSKVYTIVLNWNGERDTIDCVRSLLKMDVGEIDHKIVVVDNGSEEKSLQSIKKFIKDKPTHLIETGKNLGFADGNNVGIRYAISEKCDWIMVINNDTEVDKNLLKVLIQKGESNEKIGIVSPKIYFAKGYEYHKDRYHEKELGKVLWYAGGSIDWNNIYGTNRGVDEVDIGQYSVASEIDFATGACMLLRTSALTPKELFNSLYFMYMEDMELSLKLKRRGWKIVYEPKAVVWHKVAQSSGVGSALNDYFITRNRMLFGMSFASMRAKIALVRESYRLLFFGRKWQKVGIKDFYMGKFGKGSFK
jgi:GT2 family glycosyltransferase